MTTREEFMADLWRRATGRPSKPEQPILRLEDLEQSEWSPEFECLMRNRLLMGAYRYGTIGAPGKPRYDHAADCIARLSLYQEDGNMEHLVDVANLCLLEFVEGRHPRRHFAAQDDVLHTRSSHE